MEKLDIIAVIAKRIVAMRYDGLSDEEIHRKLFDIFEHDLDFESCKKIDALLCPEQSGEYWRNAYDFPVNGDIIQKPMNKVYRNSEDKSHLLATGIVTKCGFFTIEIEWYE